MEKKLSKRENFMCAVAVIATSDGIQNRYFRYFDDEILQDKVDECVAKMNDATVIETFRSAYPIIKYHKDMDLMRNAGFDIWQTGGGCTAYGKAIKCHENPDGSGIEQIDVMVTSIHGSTHMNEGDGFGMGLYFDDGDFWNCRHTFKRIEDFIPHFEIADNMANELAKDWDEYIEILESWLDSPLETVQHFKIKGDIETAKKLGFEVLEEENDDIISAYYYDNNRGFTIGVHLSIDNTPYVTVYDGSTHGQQVSFNMVEFRKVLRMVVNLDKSINALLGNKPDQVKARMHYWKKTLTLLSSEYDVVGRYFTKG